MEFQLRDWELTDAPELVQLLISSKVTDHLRGKYPYPYTLDDAHLFIMKSKCQSSKKQIDKAIVVDNKVAGSISLIIHDDIGCKNGEIEFWLGEGHWGKGLVTQSIEKLCRDYNDTHWMMQMCL